MPEPISDADFCQLMQRAWQNSTPWKRTVLRRILTAACDEDTAVRCIEKMQAKR